MLMAQRRSCPRWEPPPGSGTPPGAVPFLRSMVGGGQHTVGPPWSSDPDNVPLMNSACHQPQRDLPAATGLSLRYREAQRLGGPEQGAWPHPGKGGM